MADDALNLLWASAVDGTEGWRQYFYPNLPHSYAIRSTIVSEVARLARAGQTAPEIVRAIRQQFHASANK